MKVGAVEVPPALVALHAKISRMRIISSPTGMASAEKVRRKILDTYRHGL
jgi:hypothetical protein